MNTKYEIGDKVVIVSRRVDGMNNNGRMDHWLGQTMTIRSKSVTDYFMIEDQTENDGGWYWSDNMIDHEATERLNTTTVTVTCPHCGQVIEGREGYDFITVDGNVICKDCLSDDYFICDDCGKITPVSELNEGYHDGEDVTVCNHCFENYKKCNYCEEYYHKDDGRSDNCIFVCESCYDDHYCSCEDCGDFILRDDAYRVEGRSDTYYVCENCIDNYYRCDECDEYFTENRVYRDDNGNCVCDDCWDRYDYVRCYNCDTIVRCDDSYYDEDDGYDYCDSCYHDHSRNSIHNYSYKPSPMFCRCSGETTKLFMGVELEIDKGYNRNDTAAEITDAMDFDGENHVYCKSDGSLDNGIEIVSHPCTLKYHEEEMCWKEAMRIARSNSFTSHDARTCGLHVHVSRNFFGEDETEQDLAIAKLIMLVDKFWDKITTFSRRGSYELNRWASKNDIDIVEGDLIDDIKSKMSSQKSKGRYHAINLCNCSTIEFRIFRGTLKYSTFIATLQFVHTICNYAKSISLNNIYSVTWNDIFANTEYSELRNYMVSKRLIAGTITTANEETDNDDEE